jgi:hypothetical protein
MEKITHSEENPKFLKMYEVPGYESITEHSFERYQKDKENFPKDIERVPFSFSEYIDDSIKTSPSNRIEYGEQELLTLEKIKDLHVDEIPDFVRKGLVSNDPAEQRMSVIAISFARSEMRAELLREAFLIEDADIKRACVKSIANIPEKERKAFIEIGLSSDDEEIQKTAVRMIQFAEKGLRLKLIKIGLNSEDPVLKKEYAKIIHSVPEEKDRKQLLDLAKQKLGNALVEPPLYDRSNISEDHFSREEFGKTGSGTTLVGGELKDKAIFRHMAPDAFLTWQEAFEDHRMWKRAGFDYVPIEPILSFHYNKNGLVDVSSGVLDISFGEWKGMSGDFSQKLAEEKNEIKKVLSDEGIVHGHSHNDNFCLRFFRKGNGDIDYRKKPRIYLIDFDRSMKQ